MNVEAPNGPASRGGYLNRAWGIAQWLGSRLPPIDGNPNFDDQLAYVVSELRSGSDGSGGVAWQLLSTAQDADTGATGASAYERAAGSKQLFPRDNFTTRTADGIASVLATVGAYPSTTVNYGDGSSSLESNALADSWFPTPGLGTGGVIAIVAGVLLLTWLFD